MPFSPENCRNESEVESKLIVQYLLPALGYSPDTWYQEVAFGSIRLDFLAFATQVVPFVLNDYSSLSVVMEAKHPNQNLNNHVRRLKWYLTSLNVAYGLLTNGKQLRIYQSIDDNIQLVFQCSGHDIESRIEEIQALIGRESLRKKYTQKKIISVTTNPKSDSENKKQNNMKAIAIYHNKGGVGKTTVAVNLAAALRKKGKRILLIDLDSQANTTFATGLVKFQFEEEDDLKERNVYHLLESGDYNFIPDIARKSHFFNSPEIDVVPSHITLIEHQDQLNKILASRRRLVVKLKQVADTYDFVIIDTPPSRDLYAEVALIAADYLIIPSDLKPFANQGLPTVKKFIKEVNESREAVGKPHLILLGVLPSKIATNSKFLQYTFPKQRSVIPEKYELPLMETVIYDRTALSECTNQTVQIGELEIPNPKSIFDFADGKPSSNSAQVATSEFELLAGEVLQKMELK
ncbi:Restriction endonuclease, type I, EcoRI, R subunit/Type III [Gloeocapsa sp. PCC 7428]|uniref:AAA family ATPase n=1 Tax=Gloeocapsa sp. PCC 7428 TaxID=1173026 RepID=UPI0002A5D683|nr:AAA family ATPase [Gloeocapsa sp. PCC 7428]AFZ28741.1 Restriction endonuclease, type I, EcoRI, R subunit/Type III [Gloeocapsa sp. PCC 7428]